MWFGQVVHKSKWSFLFMHNWTTVYIHVCIWGSQAVNRRYPKRWVFCMDIECECRVLVYLSIFLIRFLKFTDDHQLQPHWSQIELFGVDPVVHKRSPYYVDKHNLNIRNEMKIPPERLRIFESQIFSTMIDKYSFMLNIYAPRPRPMSCH